MPKSQRGCLNLPHLPILHITICYNVIHLKQVNHDTRISSKVPVGLRKVCTPPSAASLIFLSLIRIYNTRAIKPIKL